MAVSASHLLENGDRLSRQEFETLCELQNVERAELIFGTVRMNAAAVRFREHGEPHSRIMLWLGTYAAQTSGVRVGDNTSIRMDDENVPQPDAVMFLSVERQGRCKVAADGLLEGIPELVVEIADSSISWDAHEKKNLYEAAGVAEYVLWRTEDCKIDWFCLSDGRYTALPEDEQGLVRSRVFPGLSLNRPAMLGGDLMTVLRSLKETIPGSALDT